MYNGENVNFHLLNIIISFLQYKDAFLTANPNFRWYKLPAPPLRTLTTRPLSITKNPIPLSSPTSPLSSEFNPGKLADETQLGGLTSLMNNNYTGLPKKEDEDYRDEIKFMEKRDNSVVSPDVDSRLSTPPKPIKKRFVELYTDDLKYSGRFFGDTATKDTIEDEQDDAGNLTKQDLMNKVSIFHVFKFVVLTISSIIIGVNLLKILTMLIYQWKITQYGFYIKYDR